MKERTANNDAPQQKEKGFKRRESLLTTIYNSPGGKVLYSIILSSMSLLFLTEIVRYYFNRQVLHEDLAFLARCFGQTHLALYSWIMMHVPIFAILFPAAKVTAKHTSRLLFVLSSLATLLVIIIAPVAIILNHKASEIVRTMIVLEQVRIAMKVIAYSVGISRGKSADDVADIADAVTEETVDSDENHNISDVQRRAQTFGRLVPKKPANDKVKETSKKVDEKLPEEPSLKALLYFLFAPTLMYRPSYPTLGRPRNYQVIRKCLLDIGMLMFLTLIVHRRLYEPVMMEIGAYPLSQLSVDTLLSIFVWSTIMGWLSLLGIGFGFLHCWLNIWAELLDFGDRQFYKAWWECRGIDEFMRTWNYLIHSWISSYIFKPAMSLTKNKQISLLVVILVSAFIHDYIMSMIGGVATSIFSAVVICIVIPTFLLAAPANYLQGPKGVNFFTFFVLTLTASVIGFMGGSEYATRLVYCINPKRAIFNILPGILDCKY